MRARNLKPGFFSNEQLAECEPLARILFQGLWCMADREGRLEDRPKRIKAQVLPYDNCDVEAMLSKLQEVGLIVRYEADGLRVIHVINFAKHQHPHIKEVASKLPSMEQKPSLGTVEHLPGHDPARLNPSFLNPESPILNPPSPLPPTSGGVGGKALPDVKAHNPAAYNPMMIPRARRIEVHYQKSVNPGHLAAGQREIASALLDVVVEGIASDDDHAESVLKMCAEGYVAWLKNKPPNYKRKSVATFYGDSSYRNFLEFDSQKEAAEQAAQREEIHSAMLRRRKEREEFERTRNLNGNSHAV